MGTVAVPKAPDVLLRKDRFPRSAEKSNESLEAWVPVSSPFEERRTCTRLSLKSSVVDEDDMSVPELVVVVVIIIVVFNFGVVVESFYEYIIIIVAALSDTYF